MLEFSNKLKTRKATCADCITAEALKEGGAKMAVMHLKICNAAWHQEKIRYIYWCRSLINPIHKKVNILKLPSNFPDIHPGYGILQDDTHQDR